MAALAQVDGNVAVRRNLFPSLTKALAPMPVGISPASSPVPSPGKHTRQLTLDEMKLEIEEIYCVHNPAKLGDVPRILAKYNGREALALKAIQSKYNVAPAGVGGHSVTRREIEMLFSKYDAQKLSRVGFLVAQHGEKQLLENVRKQYATATPEAPAPYVEKPVIRQRRQIAGLILDDESAGAVTAFKMQMKVAGGSTSGSLVDSLALTPERPRYEVELVSDESGHIEREEQELAAMSEYDRKVHVERMLKMWRTDDELRDTSDISYKARKRPAADLVLGLACQDYASVATAPLGCEMDSVGFTAGGMLRSRAAGRADWMGTSQVTAGDTVGCEALFDQEGAYTGFVRFDLNGGATSWTVPYRPAGEDGLCPAVSLGRGDRVIVRTTGAKQETTAPLPSVLETAEPDPRSSEGAEPVSFVCPKADSEEFSAHEFGLCPDQFEWLHENMGRFHYGSVSAVLSILILFCNREAKERKATIFRTPRCRRCTSATTGGKKVVVRMGFSDEHWHWLTNTSTRCGHASVDKTVRVLLDWYKLYATANNANLGNEIWGCSDWETYFADGGASGGSCSETEAAELGAEYMKMNHKKSGN